MLWALQFHAVCCYYIPFHGWITLIDKHTCTWAYTYTHHRRHRHSFSSQSFANKHHGWFHVLILLNCATVKMMEQGFFDTIISCLADIPRSGIVPTACCSGCANSRFHQQCTDFFSFLQHQYLWHSVFLIIVIRWEPWSSEVSHHLVWLQLISSPGCSCFWQPQLL